LRPKFRGGKVTGKVVCFLTRPTFRLESVNTAPTDVVVAYRFIVETFGAAFHVPIITQTGFPISWEAGGVITAMAT
jgi:hypothetical protein